MNDRVIVRLPVIRELDNALLLDINGRQEWVSRRQCRHKSVFNQELEMASWLADYFKIPYNRQLPRAPDTGALLLEHSFDDGVAIEPLPNQAHQQQAFDKLRRLRRFFLAMQMRSGKTKTAIDILCNHFANGRIGRVLWLCPNSAVATARQQWQRFATVDVPLQITALETVSGCGAAKWAEIRAWFTWDCAVIIDESQMMKNHRAKRSLRLFDLFEKSPVVGILSGTPITRNVQDLYNQVRILDWKIFGYRNIWQFEKAHLVMSDKYPGLIHDTVNLDYLSGRLQPFAFEWFTDYNDRKTHRRIELPMTDGQRRLYERIKNEIIRRLRNHTEKPADIYLMFTALQSVLSGHVSERVMRRLFGIAAQAVTLYNPKIEALSSLLNARTGQVVVWCNRRHELDLIAAAFPNAYIVSGKTDTETRHRSVQAFRQSRNGILIAMTQVAKRAIEMSECNEVVYFGHGFDFESREQSQWRTLLPDKTAVCRYTDLVYGGSLDDRILQSHEKKRHVARDFLDLLKSDRQAVVHEIEKL